MSLTTVANQLGPHFGALLAARVPDIRVVDIAPGSLANLTSDIDVVFAVPAPGKEPAQAPAGWPFNLRWIQLAATGIDFYPAWLFDGVPVASARGTTATAIAEFVLATLLTAAKKLPALWVNDAAQWQPQTLPLLKGSRLGIVGFGAIGRTLAMYANALGIEVSAIRRSAEPFDLAYVTRAANARELFAQSDYVVLAAPPTPELRGLVNRELLAAAKPGLHLINVARGSLIDNDALLDALNTEKIALASLDVTEPEPLPAGHAFYTHPRIRLTPHTAANNSGVLQALVDKFAANLQRVRNGEAPDNLIDYSRGY